MLNLGRVRKELKEVQESKDAGLEARLVENDYTHWKGTITGPEDSPYEGGVFQVDIRIVENYPFEPPKMKFDTRIWHPNVSSVTGAICLDILKDEWSPALTIRTALLSLQALLSAPEPDDPQDAQVANQFKSDFEAFAETARYWTNTYAKEGAEDPELPGKVANLVAMGFSEDVARNALIRAAGDENLALEYALNA